MKFQKTPPTCKIASNSLKYGGTGLAGNSCSLSPRPDKEEAGRTRCWKIFLRPVWAAFYIWWDLWDHWNLIFKSEDGSSCCHANDSCTHQTKKRGKLWLIGKKSNRLLVPVNPFIIIERLAISLLCGQVANINYAEHMLPPGGGYQFSFGEHSRNH